MTNASKLRSRVGYWESNDSWGDGCLSEGLDLMTTTFPFLTSYDPPGTSEGTLDPLGLYQIADQLAAQLVPAVRERMQRIRFLTAMAVGAFVTQEVDEDSRQRDASPYLEFRGHHTQFHRRTKVPDTFWERSA
jgi:hypothetical protein